MAKQRKKFFVVRKSWLWHRLSRKVVDAPSHLISGWTGHKRMHHFQRTNLDLPELKLQPCPGCRDLLSPCRWYAASAEPSGTDPEEFQRQAGPWKRQQRGRSIPLVLSITRRGALSSDHNSFPPAAVVMLLAQPCMKLQFWASHLPRKRPNHGAMSWTSKTGGLWDQKKNQEKRNQTFQLNYQHPVWPGKHCSMRSSRSSPFSRTLLGGLSVTKGAQLNSLMGSTSMQALFKSSKINSFCKAAALPTFLSSPFCISLVCPHIFQWNSWFLKMSLSWCPAEPAVIQPPFLPNRGLQRSGKSIFRMPGRSFCSLKGDPDPSRLQGKD